MRRWENGCWTSSLRSGFWVRHGRSRNWTPHPSHWDSCHLGTWLHCTWCFLHSFVQQQRVVEQLLRGQPFTRHQKLGHVAYGLGHALNTPCVWSVNLWKQPFVPQQMQRFDLVIFQVWRHPASLICIFWFTLALFFGKQPIGPALRIFESTPSSVTGCWGTTQPSLRTGGCTGPHGTDQCIRGICCVSWWTVLTNRSCAYHGIHMVDVRKGRCTKLLAETWASLGYWFLFLLIQEFNCTSMTLWKKTLVDPRSATAANSGHGTWTWMLFVPFCPRRDVSWFKLALGMCCFILFQKQNFCVLLCGAFGLRCYPRSLPNPSTTSADMLLRLCSLWRKCGSSAKPSTSPLRKSLLALGLSFTWCDGSHFSHVMMGPS